MRVEATNLSLGIAASLGSVLLMGCPDRSASSDSICASVGVNGGRISSADGVLSLSFRPDSLSEDTVICVEPAQRPPTGPAIAYGPAYRVTPDIDLPVSVSLTYRFDLPSDTTQTAIGRILLEDFQDGSGRWIALPVTRLEQDNKLVGATDTQLSMFYALLDDGGSLDPTASTLTGGPSDSATDTNASTVTATEPVVETDTNDTTPSTTGPTSDTATDTSSTGDSDTGPSVDCGSLPDPAFTITSLGQVFAGANSEDLAMTGNGTFIAVSIGPDGNQLLESDADGNTTVWYEPIASGMLGIAFNSSGELLVARTGDGGIDRYTMAAQSVFLAPQGWQVTNGVFVDRQDDVWVTETFGAGAIYRIDGNTMTPTTVLDGLNQPNGLFYDEDRGQLFWSLYGPGQVWRAPINNGVAGEPVLLSLVPGGNYDGMTLDECGNLYVVDQGGGANNPCRVERYFLDDVGDLIGDVQEIAGEADLPLGCANAQFGYGFGDENDQRLFVTGQPGTVYRIDVGVGGAAVPVSP